MNYFLIILTLFYSEIQTINTTPYKLQHTVPELRSEVQPPESPSFDPKNSRTRQKDSFRCDYTYFEEADGYLKFHEIPANFEEARLRCHLEGSILASPVNKGLQSVIMKLLKQNGKVILTGIHATFSSGDFFSIEGVPLSKIPHEWAPNEPYNFRNEEKCITLTPHGKMNDVNCRALYPYACYKKGNNNMDLNACGTSDNGLVRACVPVAVETSGTWGVEARTFIRDLGRRMVESGNDARSGSYLVQRISLAIQRGNAASVLGSFVPEYQLDSRTSSCYKFHRIPVTWSRAFMTCAAEDGHLVILNSETEAMVIRELFAKNPANMIQGNTNKEAAFVGVHDWNEHGEFLTIHGQTLKEAGYDKFSPGEPNNATTGQFCGAVYRSALFDDVWCEHRYAFICEKNPVDACP